MKKIILAVVIGMAATSAFADPYGNAATSSTSAGFVNSQSAASASSEGLGAAYTSTQSGAFASFGQTSTFTNAPAGAKGGTAVVSGLAQTQEYVTSQSATTGDANASSSSWNSALAGAQSYQGTKLDGYSGAASGIADSYVAGSASSSSNDNTYGGKTQIQGNTALNTSTYSASDSGILTPGTVSTVKTETSTTAQSTSTYTPNTVFGGTNPSSPANVGSGLNTVTDGGSATAVAN